MRILQAAEAHRVHRQAPVPQRLQCIQPNTRVAHPRRILATVGQQQNRPNRQIGRLRRQLLQTIADVRGAFRRRNAIQPIHPRDSTAQPIDARLKTLLQSRENAALKRSQRRGLARFTAAVRNGHAARIIHHDRNDVLLRTQRRHRHRRLPQQQQQQCDERRLRPPHRPRAPASQRWRGVPQPPPNQQRQPAGRDKNQHRQQPRRPRREQHEPPFGENRTRILEKKLKHAR